MAKRGSKPKRREVVWSPELAYAVGLMVTDGNLSPDGRHLEFTSADKGQVRTLMRCFNLVDVKLARKRSGLPSHDSVYRVQWGDVVLYGFLLRIGLTPRKSRTLGPLSIPKKYFFDFLRGHFDGDGTFYSYYDPRWKSSFMFYLSFVSASENHITWLRELIKRETRARGFVTKGKGVIQLRFGKRESLTILAKLYSANSSHLKRKRLKIQRALRIVGLALPS